MRSWADVVPANVAVAQRTWEWNRKAWRMRSIGMTYREIGERLGVSVGRARQRVEWFERKYINSKAKNPVEKYLAEPSFTGPLEARRFMNQKPKLGKLSDIEHLERVISGLQAKLEKLKKAKVSDC